MFILAFSELHDFEVNDVLTNPYHNSQRMHNIHHSRNVLHMSNQNTHYAYQQRHDLENLAHLILYHKVHIHNREEIRNVQRVYHGRNEYRCHQAADQEQRIKEKQSVFLNQFQHFPHIIPPIVKYFISGFIWC